jgi:hypothetical protein
MAIAIVLVVTLRECDDSALVADLGQWQGWGPRCWAVSETLQVVRVQIPGEEWAGPEVRGECVWALVLPLQPLILRGLLQNQTQTRTRTQKEN